MVSLDDPVTRNIENIGFLWSHFSLMDTSKSFTNLLMPTAVLQVVKPENTSQQALSLRWLSPLIGKLVLNNGELFSHDKCFINTFSTTNDLVIFQYKQWKVSSLPFLISPTTMVTGETISSRKNKWAVHIWQDYISFLTNPLNWHNLLSIHLMQPLINFSFLTNFKLEL